jgi:raffinose/stachyose/melibiose transport system substrate-binding protein
VKDVDYTNPDLKRLSPWLDKNTALAARFQFQNLDVRNAVEASATAVISGTSPEQAAEAAQKIVDERI